MDYIYNYKNQKSKVFNNPNDLLESIVIKARIDIANHSLNTFYIYENDKLIHIIKASDLDPLSKNRENWSKEQREAAFYIKLKEVLDDINIEIPRLFKLACGNNIRNDEQYIEGIRMTEIIENFEFSKRKEDIMEEYYDSCDSDEIYSFSQKVIEEISLLTLREYKMKYRWSKKPDIYINHLIDLNNPIKKGNVNSIYNFLLEHDYINDKVNLYSFVFAYDNDKCIGLFPIFHGEEKIYKIEISLIYKFLLLVGANSYSFVHTYHNNNNVDYYIYDQLKEIDKILETNIENYLIINDKNEYQDLINY